MGSDLIHCSSLCQASRCYEFMFDKDGICTMVDKWLPVAVNQPSVKVFRLSRGPNGKTNQDCLADANGFYYSGNLDTTLNGRTCQRWDQQTPHWHDYVYLGDQNNFCRNPGNYSGIIKLWCYTMDSGKRWEGCPTDWPMCMDY